MIQKADRLFKQEGYQFIKVSPEEAGVYYKLGNGTAQVIIGINMHPGFSLDADKLQTIQNHLRELFLHPQGRIPGCEQNMVVYEVQMLTLLFSADTARIRDLCSVCTATWGIDTSVQRLLIYENQPGDFCGLRERLQGVCEKRQEPAAAKRSIRALPFVNITIVLLNIVVFLALSAMGDVQSGSFILEHGGMYPVFVLQGHEWWRLFTSMFIHFGIAHLANNMLILFFTGDKLEKMVGKVKYLAIYLGSGMCGGLLSLYMMQRSGELAVSAGASGAIFGVIGALLWIVIRNRGKVESLTTRGLLIMIALSLYFGFTSTGVDNWCHVGGLLGGFLLSVLLYRRKD